MPIPDMMSTIKSKHLYATEIKINHYQAKNGAASSESRQLQTFCKVIENFNNKSILKIKRAIVNIG